MVRLFREDFDTQAGFASRWSSISEIEVQNGSLQLTEGLDNEGSAIRRTQAPSAILTAYASGGVYIPPYTDVDVFLSRNGRHFMRAARDLDSGVWSVSLFNESDGTADYTDTSYSADGTNKTLSIRIALTGNSQSTLTTFVFGALTASGVRLTPLQTESSEDLTLETGEQIYAQV